MGIVKLLQCSLDQLLPDGTFENLAIGFDAVFGFIVERGPFLVRKQRGSFKLWMLSRGATGPMGAHASYHACGSGCFEVIVRLLQWILAILDGAF